MWKIFSKLVINFYKLIVKQQSGAKANQRPQLTTGPTPCKPAGSRPLIDWTPPDLRDSLGRIRQSWSVNLFHTNVRNGRLGSLGFMWFKRTDLSDGFVHHAGLSQVVCRASIAQIKPFYSRKESVKIDDKYRGPGTRGFLCPDPSIASQA